MATLQPRDRFTELRFRPDGHLTDSSESFGHSTASSVECGGGGIAVALLSLVARGLVEGTGLVGEYEGNEPTAQVYRITEAGRLAHLEGLES